MINTSASSYQYVRPQDGSLLDRDPGRRAERLRSAGVRIEHRRPFSHVVHLPGAGARRCHTFGAAQRIAHGFIDARGRR